MASFVIRPRCCGPFVFSKRVKKSGGEEKSPGPALSPRTKTTKATCESAVMGIMQNYGHGGGGRVGERGRDIEPIRGETSEKIVLPLMRSMGLGSNTCKDLVTLFTGNGIFLGDFYCARNS